MAKYTETTIVMLSPLQKQRLRWVAKLQGITISEAVRRMIDAKADAEEKSRPRPGHKKEQS